MVLIAQYQAVLCFPPRCYFRRDGMSWESGGLAVEQTVYWDAEMGALGSLSWEEKVENSLSKSAEKPTGLLV